MTASQDGEPVAIWLSMIWLRAFSSRSPSATIMFISTIFPQIPAICSSARARSALPKRPTTLNSLYRLDLNDMSVEALVEKGEF